MKTIVKISLASVLTAWALAVNSFGDVTSFPELLSGKTVPLTLKMKDLNDEWRRINVGPVASSAGGVSAIYSAMLGGAAGGGVYYTKGQTVTIGGEAYLIAYHATAKATDPASLQQLMRGGQMPEAEKPTAQTSLALSLLNMRLTGSFNDIRPFNFDFETTGSESALATEDEKRVQETNSASLTNLRKLGTALLTYERERKVLPLFDDARTAQEELVLYVSGKEVFLQPETKKPYQPNPALSGKKRADFDKPAETVVLYEATASADGTRGVLFLDGHVERCPEAKWKRLKQDARLP